MGGVFKYGADEEYSIIGAVARVIYTRNGIEAIRLYNVNETDYSQYKEEELIDYDKAKELLPQKFSNIIFDGEVKVDAMQLIYLPVPKNNLGDYYSSFEVRPFYAFYCTQTENYSGEKFTSSFISYFDAITGKEFGTEY